MRRGAISRAACSARWPAGRAQPTPFPGIAARVHVAGYDITGARRYDGPAEPDGLPLYPWNRERFWFERTVEAGNLTDPRFDHPLLGFRQTGTVRSWLNHLDPDILPWLADHAVEGVPVLPGAAIVEMALAAARLRRPDAAAIEVSDIELRRPLPFEKGRTREIRSTEIGEDGDWELTSRPRLADDPPTLHAVARLTTAGEFVPPPLFGPAGPSRAEIDAASLYRLAARLGLEYGARFRTVRRIELLGPGDGGMASRRASGRRWCSSTPRLSTRRLRRTSFIPRCSTGRCRDCWR